MGLSSTVDNVGDTWSVAISSFVGEAFAKTSNSSITATEIDLNSGMTSGVRFGFGVGEWDEW